MFLSYGLFNRLASAVAVGSLLVFPAVAAADEAAAASSSGASLKLYDSGDYYQAITDGDTGEIIGEMFRDDLYDESGTNLLGTNQGYCFNFTSINKESDDDQLEENCNLIFFFGDDNDEEGGEINILNNYIVSATGSKYERFQGGTYEEEVITTDPSYTAYFILHEPEEGDGTTASSSSSTTIQVQAEGGYYLLITAVGESNATNNITDSFADKFVNPVYDVSTTGSDGSPIGTNQGFALNFPPVEGYGNMSVKSYNANRHIVTDDGSINLFNLVVVSGTGTYAMYKGTVVSETVVSPDPNWVSEITLSTSTSATTEAPNEKAHGTFTITSEGGYSELILDPTTEEKLGELFQDQVLDSTSTKIGTNQGYQFFFPPPSEDDHPFVTNTVNGNRVLYLDGGTLNVFNEVIVHATGAYANYSGGTFNETVLSYEPWLSEVTLVLPSSSTLR